MLGFLSHNRQARQSAQPPLQKIVLLFLLLLTLGGCYWLKYGKLMRTHIDLLLSMADKMGSLLEAERTITPAMMSEFSYPLERARDFARIVGRRYAERQSLQAFRQFLDIYAELVHETDRLRVLNGDLSGFHERVAALHKQATVVEAALAAEER